MLFFVVNAYVAVICRENTYIGLLLVPKTIPDLDSEHCQKLIPALMAPDGL